MIKARVGDEVMIECYAGLASGGPATVTKITHESIITEKNGDIVKTKKTKVIWCGDMAFDAKTGRALTSPWMYYISH